MADVKDILGIKGAPAAPREKPEQQKQKKPKGMSREAFALLDDSHPIMPSQLVASSKALKEKQKRSKGKVTWTYEEFRNSARADDEKWRMKRWQKRVYDAQGNLVTPPPDDYWAVKYNRSVDLVQYDDEEYAALLNDDPDWTKEETDRLFKFCKIFAMRFTVMADRWANYNGKERTVEDLRARYSAVARKLLVAREGGVDQAAHHYLVRHPYSAEHERERKNALRNLYVKTVRGQREDSAVLAKARELEAQRREELRNLFKPEALEASALQSENAPVVTEFFLDLAKPSLLDAALRQPRLPPGVYPRGGFTKSESAKIRLAIAGGPKAQKQFDAMLAELGFSMEGGRWPLEFPNAPVCANFLALQQELADHLDFKRRVQGQSAAQGPVAVKTLQVAASKRKNDWEGAAGLGTPRSSKRAKG